jgi:hypothetical protein
MHAAQCSNYGRTGGGSSRSARAKGHGGAPPLKGTMSKLLTMRGARLCEIFYFISRTSGTFPQTFFSPSPPSLHGMLPIAWQGQHHQTPNCQRHIRLCPPRLFHCSLLHCRAGAAAPQLLWLVGVGEGGVRSSERCAAPLTSLASFWLMPLRPLQQRARVVSGSFERCDEGSSLKLMRVTRLTSDVTRHTSLISHRTSHVLPGTRL